MPKGFDSFLHPINPNRSKSTLTQKDVTTYAQPNVTNNVPTTVSHNVPLGVKNITVLYARTRVNPSANTPVPSSVGKTVTGKRPSVPGNVNCNVNVHVPPQQRSGNNAIGTSSTGLSDNQSKYIGLMRTRVKALIHPSVDPLLQYATAGCPVDCGPDWTIAQMETMMVNFLTIGAARSSVKLTWSYPPPPWQPTRA